MITTNGDNVGASAAGDIILGRSGSPKARRVSTESEATADPVDESAASVGGLQHLLVASDAPMI